MIKKTTCSLDCFDTCSMLAQVEEGKVVALKGNPDHPVTQGFLCKKGHQHLANLRDPDRLKSPLLKTKKGFVEISYEEAFGEIASRLRPLIEENRQKAILHYYDGGYGGISKEVDKLFFAHCGGAVTHRGGLCWSAGFEVSKLLLGQVFGTMPEEVLEGDTIILWGRNPLETNLHLAHYLRKAQKMGHKIIAIDPLVTPTTKLADLHVALRPGSDSYLVLGLLKVWPEKSFSKALVDQLEKTSMETILEKTGLSLDDLQRMVKMMGKKIYTYIGYGMQRYFHGAHGVGSIMSFLQVIGQLEGVNYANQGFAKELNMPASPPNPYKGLYPKSRLGQYLLESDIELAFFLKSNPLVQVPHTRAVQKGLAKIPFKVGIDLFMTDTMRACDLVLPATSPLEEEDLYAGSMYSPYLQYAEEVVPPKVLGEYEVFRQLARRLGLRQYPDMEKTDFLKAVSESVLERHGETWQTFTQKGFLAYQKEPGEKYISEAILLTYLTGKMMEKTRPFRLLTPHHRNSLHSQGYRKVTELPKAYVHPDHIKGPGLAYLENDQGRVKVELVPDQTMQRDLIKVYEGYWHHSGCINTLTPDMTSDYGDQATFYDAFVSISYSDL